MYKPTKWTNRIKDEKGNILKDGTGLWAKYLNNMEAGIVGAYKQFENVVDKEDGKTLTSNDFSDFYRLEVDKIPEYLKLKVDKEDGKVLSSNDFLDIYKNKLDKLDYHLFSKVDKEEGKTLTSNDFTDEYVNMLLKTRNDLKTKNTPLGLLQLDSKGLISKEFIPSDFKEHYVVSSMEEVEEIEEPFKSMRVVVLDEVSGEWIELMYNGEKFIKLTSSSDLDITLDWSSILDKPTEFTPTSHNHSESEVLGLDKYTRKEVDEKLATKALKEHTHSIKDMLDLSVYSKKEMDSKLEYKAELSHTHSERDIHDLDKYTREQIDRKLEGKSNYSHVHTEKDIEDLDKYTKEETDKLLAAKLTEENNIIQTVYNSIGWEKNIFFKAEERFTVIEHNTKIGQGGYKTFFDGGLDPITIPNVNKDNPYIVEISGLPAINTQGKGCIGFVSRFRYPKDFKIEWFNSRDSKWEILADETGWNKAYYYSSNFTGSATKVKLTVTRVQGDDFLQLAQIVFINPEASVLYDHLLAKDIDVKELGSDIKNIESEISKLGKSEHTHTNKGVLDKIEYLGSRDKVDLDKIYTHSHNWDGIKNKPTDFNPSKHNHGIGEITNLQATLDDLESKIPTGGVASVNGQTGEVILDANNIEFEGNSVKEAFDELLENMFYVWLSKADQNHTHDEYAKKEDLPKNFDLLKKLVDLGNNSQIDLGLIYTHKHNYNEIQNKPHIPNKITDLDDDVNLVISDIKRQIVVSATEPIGIKEGDIWIRI